MPNRGSIQVKGSKMAQLAAADRADRVNPPKFTQPFKPYRSPKSKPAASARVPGKKPARSTGSTISRSEMDRQKLLQSSDAKLKRLVKIQDEITRRKKSYEKHFGPGYGKVKR